MSVYYTLYLGVILFSGLIYLIHRKLNSRIFIVLVGCILVIFSGIRADYVGTDTYKYHVIFDLINSTNSSLTDIPKQNGLLSGIEVGYIFLNKFVYFLHGNFHILVFIISLFTVLGIFIYIYKLSPDYFLSIYIYIGMGYYFLSFNISRQFLAIAIAYWGLTKSDKKWQVLIIIIAGLIHNSAFLVLLLWIPLQIRLDKSKYQYIIPWIFVIILGPVYWLLQKIMENIPRYNMYLDMENNSGGILNVLLLIFMICIYAIFIKSFDSIHDSNAYIILYSTIFIIVFYVYTLLSPLFGRLQYVFLPMMIVNVPYIIEHSFLKKYRLIIALFFICVGLYMLTKIPNNLGYGIIPYGIN